MQIKSEAELQAAIQRVSRDLQCIQDYLGGECRKDAKIRFPRGFIRKAEDLRKRFWFFTDDIIKRNLSYQLILSDVFRWLLNRTDLFGTGKEMIIKEGICLFASQCETILKIYCGTKVAKRKGFGGRIDYLLDQNIISKQARDELDWLWNTRTGSHIFLVERREHELYKICDYNRARNAYRSLGRAIEEYESSRMQG